jgi:hypothetical protein
MRSVFQTDLLIDLPAPIVPRNHTGPTFPVSVNQAVMSKSNQALILSTNVQTGPLEMKLSDYLGFALAVGFGMWWVSFPTSVIDFYKWFHKGGVKTPSTFGVRLTGCLWILLVAIVMVFAFRKH